MLKVKDKIRILPKDCKESPYLDWKSNRKRMRILPIKVLTFFRMGILPIQSRLVPPPVYNRQYARCCTQNGTHDGEGERIR